MRNLKVIYILLIQLFWIPSALAQVEFTADITQGCSPLSVKFSIDPSTVDADTVSSAEWLIGIRDSTLTSLDPDTFIFRRGGVYTVSLVINGNTDAAVTKTDFITVYQTVSAVFRSEEYAANHNYRFIPLDKITDSTASYIYMWRYSRANGEVIGSNDKIVKILNPLNAIDTFQLDTGIYNVGLRIEDTYGCISRSMQRVIVAEEVIIPNVFCPGQEEFYIINPQNLNTVLKFQVFNRYGVLVFTQTAPIINWSGQTETGAKPGAYLNTGVYFYVLESIEGDPEGRYNKQGFIHLYK